MNYLIKDKQRFIEALRMLHIEEYIQAKALHTLDDLFIQIESNTMKMDILERISYRLICDHLMNFKQSGNEIKLGSPIDFVFKTKNARLVNSKISKINNSWKLPSTVLTTKSFLMSAAVFLILCGVVFLFIKIYPEFFIVTFDVLSISFLLLILVIPELLLRFLLPGIFGVEKFINVKTIDDLTNELHRLNKNDYLLNNYQRMREEIFNLYGPF